MTCTPIGKLKYIIGGGSGLCVREREGEEGSKRIDHEIHKSGRNRIGQGGQPTTMKTDQNRKDE